MKQRPRSFPVLGGVLAAGLVLVAPQTSNGTTAHASIASGEHDSRAGAVRLELLGRFETGIFDDEAATKLAYDPGTSRIFWVNAATDSVDVADISDPANPVAVMSLDVGAHGDPSGVDVKGGLVAVAVHAPVGTDPGTLVFFDLAGDELAALTTGAQPYEVRFTPNGRKAVVLNEAEPSDDYSVDPEGSVTIVDVSEGAAGLTQEKLVTADFGAWNDRVLDASIRVFGPGATVAQDFEPEGVAFSHDSRTAYVVLQENNAVAVVDLGGAIVTDIYGLGFKDHSLPGQGLDASNRDGEISIRRWPVRGMFLPDNVESVLYRGDTYLVMANEGDSRDYDGFSEEARVGDLLLDPAAFPDAADLQEDSALGRLKVTTVNGDNDGDGDFDELFSFGARSITIRDANTGTIVWDSGDQLERLTAAALPALFNADNDSNEFDDRSDDKGPEPEGLTVGRAFGQLLAFVGLERVGGIVVYDITNPSAPVLQDYLNTRDPAIDPSRGGGDHGPEGLAFVKAEDSPTGEPLLVVSHEVSGTVAVFAVLDGR